jgi:hypothetical protein
VLATGSYHQCTRTWLYQQAQCLASQKCQRKRHCPIVCGVQRRLLSVGPLRWKPPVTAQAWSGARSASRFGAICQQIIGNEVKGDGDCLTTNIWRPQCHKHSVRWKNIRPDKPHHQHPVTTANHPGGFRVAGANVLIAAEGNFAPRSSPFPAIQNRLGCGKLQVRTEIGLNVRCRR